VSARSLEIATLRAIGFGASGIVLSVFAEAIALSLAGGSIGALLAWLLYNGKAVDTKGGQFIQLVFHIDVTPIVVVQGMAGALLIGLVGGLLPAIRAAKLQVATALRERWSESVPTLTRAGQAQDDTDDRGRRACDDLIELVDVDAHLSRENRQKEKSPDHDPHAMRRKAGERCREHLGQHPDRDATAIEGREWDQVEECENDIDADCVGEIPQHPLTDIQRQNVDRVQEQRCGRRQREVHDRSGSGHPDHVAAGISQLSEVHRHGLGISKEKGCMCQQQECRQEERAEGIDMP
jgi:hypothetical protein